MPHRLILLPMLIVLVCLLVLPLHAGVRTPVVAQWTEIDGVRVPVPPAGHPRLFLGAQHLPDLIRRVEHPVLAPVWKELQQLGTRNKEYRMQVDALRYLLSQDAALGRRTIATALDTLASCSFQARSDITRPIGRMLVAGAVVYDWCYNLMTDEQKREMREHMVRLAGMLECGYPPRGDGDLTGHQSEWMVWRDMLSAGVAIYDEDPEMYNFAAKRAFEGLIPARDFWYPGHAFHQGTAYAETRFSSNLYPLWIFDRMGAGNVFHPSQQFVPYHWLYVRRPDGKLLNAGDNESKTPRLRSLLAASYYSDGYVLSDYLITPGIGGMNKFYELLWSDPDLQPLPLTDLPTSRYFGFPNGWMVARSGWQSDAVVCEMKVNIYNFVNHQHQDAGAFQIYYKGPLAMDTGLYEGLDGGYISDHNVNYYKRTVAHNSILVYDPDEKFETRGFREIEKLNDGGQRLPNRWAEAKNPAMMQANDFQTGQVLGHWMGPDQKEPDFTYMKGDITQAYSAKVEQVQRSFAFLNFGGTTMPAALVVFDRVISANPDFKKTWLLHSEEEPTVSGNTTTVTLGQRGWSGKLVNHTLLPRQENTSIELIGGPGKEFWVAGRNITNRPRRNPERYEMGAWRAEVSPKTSSGLDYFLNVMLITDTGATEILPKPLMMESGQILGVQLAGRAVLFNKTAKAATKPIAWQTTGAGTIKHLVAGLTPGNWQLWRDGRIVQPVISVSSDAGTASFQGPAGSYEMRR